MTGEVLTAVQRPWFDYVVMGYMIMAVVTAWWLVWTVGIVAEVFPKRGSVLFTMGVLFAWASLVSCNICDCIWKDYQRQRRHQQL